MTTRKKLELPLNQTITVSMLYDEPVSGNGKYGAFHLYAVRVEDEEFSFFTPNDEVHDQIKNLRRGDSFLITKLATQRGNKVVTTHEVKLLHKEVKVAVTQTAEANHEENDVSPAPHDRFFDIMLNCYRDALEISKELNGMADPEKIAVTLFIARSKQNGY